MRAFFLILTWISMMAGNFTYQAFADHNWDKAIDVSFYQLIVFIVIGLQMWMGCYDKRSI